MLYVHVCVCIHTLDGVGWEPPPPPRGPCRDLLAMDCRYNELVGAKCSLLFIIKILLCIKR